MIKNVVENFAITYLLHFRVIRYFVRLVDDAILLAESKEARGRVVKASKS